VLLPTAIATLVGLGACAAQPGEAEEPQVQPQQSAPAEPVQTATPDPSSIDVIATAWRLISPAERANFCSAIQVLGWSEMSHAFAQRVPPGQRYRPREARAFFVNECGPFQNAPQQYQPPVYQPRPVVPTYPRPVVPQPPQVPRQPVAPPSNGCDPNYTGCVPIASDVDCAGGSGNGPAYANGPVQVIGTDIYGLDGNGDGLGCE